MRYVRMSAILVAVAVLLAAGADAAEPASFARTDYKVPGRPTKVLSGDFDLNGTADLVSFNGTCRILPGLGDGTFLKGKSVAGGRSAMNAAVVDLNGDSRPDIAVENMSGVRFNINSPDGKWRTAPGIGLKMPFGGLAVDDFNGDGRQDLAVGQLWLHGGYWGISYQDYFVCVYMAAGDGTFLRTEHIQVQKSPWAMATGDYNNDGNRDIVASNERSGGLTEILGLLGGGFATQTLIPGPLPNQIVTADLNEDGFEDAAVANAGWDVMAVFYGGPGGLTAPERYAVAHLSGSLAVGDLNGDGRLDIAVTRYLREGLVTILYGQEGGGFGDATDYPVGKYPRGVLAADLDGDTLADLAIANRGSNTLSVLINTTGQ